MLGFPIAIFVVSALLLLYVSALYPFVLLLWRKIRINKPDPDYSTMTYFPTVTITVAVYNEQNILPEKLKNLLQLEYPKNRLTVLFGSDGSTDETNKILSSRNDERIRFIPFPKRRGKAAILNDLVPQAEGEIVVLSDANTFYDSKSIQNLVQPFQNPYVGAVCGALSLQGRKEETGGIGEETYWNYDTLVKKLEAEIRTAVAANGALYAIRKKLFQPLPMNKSVSDDIYIPLSVLNQGFRMAFVSNAVAFERLSDSVSGEFQRRARIVTRNLYSIFEFSSLLHPRAGFIAFALWSHKILRWGIPFYVMLLLFSCAVLSPYYRFFLFALLIQIAFWIIAGLGFLFDRLKIHQGLFGFPYYFIAMNTAIFVGIVKFLFRRHQFTWEPVR